MIGFKPAADAGRFQPAIADGLVRPAPRRIKFDLPQQGFEPIRYLAGDFQGATTHARPIAGSQGFRRRGKEVHIALPRFPRRTRGPAKNARCLHGHEEDSVIRRVAVQQRPIHLVGTGQVVRRQGQFELVRIHAAIIRGVRNPATEESTANRDSCTRAVDSMCRIAQCARR